MTPFSPNFQSRIYKAVNCDDLMNEEAGLRLVQQHRRRNLSQIQIIHDNLCDPVNDPRTEADDLLNP